MIPENYMELLIKLIKGTQLKKIVWEKTSRDSEYKTILGSSMVTTDEWEDPMGRVYVDMGIWNSNGEQVDSVSRAEGSDDFEALKELHDTARASYLKVDETISEILSHLDF